MQELHIDRGPLEQSLVVDILLVPTLKSTCHENLITFIIEFYTISTNDLHNLISSNVSPINRIMV
jgi:hypothetical protein